ncbi:pimeloyl-ACP methyl esterase BioG family protein [Ruegeria atlantica]|uniref:pimeloyl-ACP methyl esterase BioG family protein n=1 Tax=Ruegeria atlantica TaxID=81569 RepID=UPI00147F6D1C|nr:pimeloyl-ACP methyl esterase BioG family protein [Ruegeria atlantica]
MKQRWLSRLGTKEVLVIFGGWALGAAPFESVAGDMDVLLVEDYTRLDDPLTDLVSFGRVNLLAFSFGVASAAHWLAQTGFRPDKLTAVSGTLSPADPECGIVPDLIRATAEHLSPANFTKFCRRAGLDGPAPEIDIDAARAELYAVIDRGTAPDTRFDRIWIPERDRIIPSQAQHAAWVTQQEAVRRISGAHVPFQSGQSWEEWLV